MDNLIRIFVLEETKKTFAGNIHYGEENRVMKFDVDKSDFRSFIRNLEPDLLFVDGCLEDSLYKSTGIRITVD